MQDIAPFRSQSAHSSFPQSLKASGRDVNLIRDGSARYCQSFNAIPGRPETGHPLSEFETHGKWAQRNSIKGEFDYLCQRCLIAVPISDGDKGVMRVLSLIGSIAALLAAAPANALCFYTKADFYAGKVRSYTTISQEFRDSRWVVRARVVSARYHSTDGDSWTLYTVRVLDRFKGSSTRTMRVFTYRDSGGFYLDKGMNSPDRANDYLLFLNPATQILPRGMRNVVQVNFSCGQSRPWKELTRADLGKLDLLARRPRL